jgi:ribosome-associated protein
MKKTVEEKEKKVVKKTTTKKATVASGKGKEKTKPVVKKAAVKTKKAAPAKKAVKPKKSPAELLLGCIVDAMADKKGNDIVVMDLRKIENAVCSYFVICHAASSTQVLAIADYIEEKARKTIQEKAWQREGFTNAQWVLLDYVTIVAHVFQPKARQFYRLEDLWADAEIMRPVIN